MGGKRPRVLIAGGSLGGLTAALHLRDVGCEVEVFERSSAPLEGRGAGIVLHPATVRYLASNGRMRVDEVSTRADVLRYLDRDGKVRHEEPCRYRFTSYYTLYRGLLSCFPAERYHLDAKVVGLHQNDEGATVRVTGRNDASGDLVVFADGIHSTGRSLLFPDVESNYAGYVGWRGTVSEADLDPIAFRSLHEAITYFVGRDTHILTYPIPDLDGSIEPGKRRINFVWYRNVAAGQELSDLLTDRSGVTRDVSLGPGAVRDEHVKALFDAAREELPATMAHAVVESREPFVQAVYDVDVPGMAFGRACLIGDAAFVIRPHAAAGTAKAAEDAYKLAEAMSECHGNVECTLNRWEPAQLEMGRGVLLRARDLGERSQFLGTFDPPDPYLSFGLYRPGDSWMHEGVGT